MISTLSFCRLGIRVYHFCKEQLEISPQKINQIRLKPYSTVPTFSLPLVWTFHDAHKKPALSKRISAELEEQPLNKGKTSQISVAIFVNADVTKAQIFKHVQ